jgi:hypothetical protein
MNKELEKRLKVLRPLFQRLQCQQHSAYCAKHFCSRKQCGFGFVCEACEELEHSALRHHMLDDLGIDNLIEVGQLMDQVFGNGLHYEEREHLFPNFTKEHLKLINDAITKLESQRNKQAKELDELVLSLQKDALQKIELRFKKLRKDLAEELNQVFDQESRPLLYIYQAIENINKKREFSLERLLTELEFAKIMPEESVSSKKTKKSADEASYLDMQRCALAFQEHLESTYNYIDVKYMQDIRKSIAYLELPDAKVKVDLSRLSETAGISLTLDLDRLFEKLKQITTVSDGGLEGALARAGYPDNLAKNISCRYEMPAEAVSKTTVDTRVKLATDSPVTALCTFAKAFVVAGFQSGILKVVARDQPDVRADRSP